MKTSKAQKPVKPPKKPRTPKTGATKRALEARKALGIDESTFKLVMRGRPTKYKGEETNTMARKLALLGATDVEMAGVFEVDVSTIAEWKILYPDFSNSINDGKAKADAEIADSLYNRAKGYSHPDVHISNFQGEVTLTPITKYYPPDTAAAFIWLKNRKSQAWKDKVEVVRSIESLSDAELDELIKQKSALLAVNAAT